MQLNVLCCSWLTNCYIRKWMIGMKTKMHVREIEMDYLVVVFVAVRTTSEVLELVFLISSLLGESSFAFLPRAYGYIAQYSYTTVV